MLTPEELEKRRMELEERRRERRARRRKRTIFYILCALLGIVLMVGTAYWSFYSLRAAGGGQASAQPSRVTVLLLGVDSGLGGGTRTDTMIVATIDKQKASVDAVAIPRDTRVRIPGRSGFDRVNAAHAYGGPQLAVRTVESLLGIDIDYYVRIDYKGFETIVDTLGGVVIDVEKPMRYVDNAQGLNIDLKPGVQRLRGKEALDYVRYRDALGDVSLIDEERMAFGGRIERQLKFARALMDQVFSARAIFSVPKLFADLKDTVATDMPATTALDLALALYSAEELSVNTAILPGSGQMVNGVAYWVVNEPLAREVVNKHLLHLPGMVRVEVLNGSGASGAASRAADVLRTKGFEVVAVRNADRFDYSETAIIARGGDPVLASEVAAALGAPGRIRGREALPANASAEADVTIILGRDFMI